MALPDTLRVSIYNDGRPGRFAKLNESNVEMMKFVLSDMQVTQLNKRHIQDHESDSLLCLMSPRRIKNSSESGSGDIEWGGEDFEGGDEDDENDWTEYRTIQWDIINMTSNLFNDVVTSKLVATFNCNSQAFFSSAITIQIIIKN